MDYIYYKLNCSKCGRKILVEIALCGTNHNLSVIATCADCLKSHWNEVPEEFLKERKQEAKDIKAWVNDERS
jgi:hypothetical protein